MGINIALPINANLTMESILFIFLLIDINIIIHTQYLIIYGVQLPDNAIPINVDINTGILYLSILDMYKKNAIPNGAIDPIKIDLLNKNPIIENIIVLESIYLDIFIFIISDLILLLVLVDSFFHKNNPPYFTYNEIVAKMGDFFCHNQFNLS